MDRDLSTKVLTLSLIYRLSDARMFRKIAEYTPFPAITGHFDLLLPKRLSSQCTCQASAKSFASKKCKECERHFFIYLLLDIGCPIQYCPFIDIGIGMNSELTYQNIQ